MVVLKLHWNAVSNNDFLEDLLLQTYEQSNELGTGDDGPFKTVAGCLHYHVLLSH